MAGFGPPPKPQAQQRRRGRDLASQASTRLPAEGRQGEPPLWPLSRASRREAELWERLWQTPQATAWELLGWIDIVGRYARLLSVAEKRNAPVAILAETRQLEDRLGLSPMSMLRLRWEVVEEEISEGAATEMLDIRERLRAAR